MDLYTTTNRTQLKKLLSEDFKGEFSLNAPLKKHTWYEIGGPADVIAYPKNIDDLKLIIDFCKQNNTPYYLIGEGANLLVSDFGFRGIIIKLNRFFNSFQIKDMIITADAGISFNDLILYCEEANLGGLEYFSGIPGSVGGMLMMNAGTSKGEIGEILEKVYYLDENLNVSILNKNQITFDYRHVKEFQNKILLKCELNVREDDGIRLKKLRLAQIQMRAAKQPLEYPSCGSVFKRPKNHYVGKLVEDLNLKGFTYGDAMISEKHGGFIVNKGNARANDIMYIIRKVQDEVYKHFQVRLEPEVKFLGF